jgi:two-component system cell cycle sensor histidine kinase/response regulator CckA
MHPQSKTLPKVQLGATILVVDDQPEILAFVSGFLLQLGYTVLKATSGEEALLRSKEHESRIELLISNIQMPGITGIELATKISMERPDIKVMLMSGYPSGMLVLNESWHFLAKPFVPRQLRELVSLAINSQPTPELKEREDQGK